MGWLFDGFLGLFAGFGSIIRALGGPGLTPDGARLTGGPGLTPDGDRLTGGPGLTPDG